MKFKDYTWDKDFEIKGYYSETPDGIIDNNYLSGTLYYSSSEIILELFGEFEEEQAFSFGFGKELEKIYGFSNNGKILILNTYREPMRYSTTPGFPITKYRVKNFTIYDVYYNGLDDFDYSIDSYCKLIDYLDSKMIMEYRFSFDHIKEWIEKSLVNIKHKENQDIFESAINEYKPTKVSVNSLGIDFEDGATLHSLYDTTSFNSDYYINVKSSNLEVRHFKEFYDASLKFKEFVEVISNTPLSFTNIEFIVQYKTLNQKCIPLIKGKYFVQHARKFKKWKKNSNNEISLNRLSDKFEIILNNWFMKAHVLEFIVRQFSKTLHGDLYLEDQLVDAIRNLEVYSRNFTKFTASKPTLSSEQENARQKVIDFINTSILKEFRRNLKNRIKPKYREPKLSERLLNLFENIDLDNQIKLFSKFKDKELLVQKLVDTRNYYTHGDLKENYPNLITNFNEMYEVKVLLQDVLRYYIYQELDMKYK